MRDERQQEIQEFTAMLNALCRKYGVSLGVSVVDLAKEPIVDSQEQPGKAGEAPEAGANETALKAN